MKLSNKKSKEKAKTFTHKITVPTSSLTNETFFEQLRGKCKDMLLFTIKNNLIDIFNVLTVDLGIEMNFESFKDRFEETRENYNIDVAFESDYLLNMILRKTKEKNKYYELTKDIKKYGNNKYDYNFYVDTDKFNFYLGDFNIKLIDITEEMINKDNFNKEKEFYEIKTMNEVKVHLTEQELENYLCKMKKIIEFKYKLHIEKEREAGFMVKIDN